MASSNVSYDLLPPSNLTSDKTIKSDGDNKENKQVVNSDDSPKDDSITGLDFADTSFVPPISTVYIPDVSVEAFRWFLHFVSGLKPKIKSNITVDLLYLSNKYMMKQLEQDCLGKLKSMFKEFESMNQMMNVLVDIYNHGLTVS